MVDQLFIGNFLHGLKDPQGRLPFNIDNDAFPLMYNFYSWRGRAKRKRGTVPLGQLAIQVQMVTGTRLSWQYGQLNLTGGAGNLITGLGLPATSTIAPGSIQLSSPGGQLFTEPATPNGTLNGSSGSAGTINYATGAVTVNNGAAYLIGTFAYYPGNPVMGLEDFVVPAVFPTPPSVQSDYPVLLAFDTTNAYQVDSTQPMAEIFHNVTFYKATNVPFQWSGGNYQLFGSTNYQGALWATNNVPGFNFVFGTYVSGSGTTTITFTFTTAGAVPFTKLVVNDVLWFNEWAAGGTTINGITGVVSAIVNAVTGTYAVTFATSQTVSGTGIAQLLTNTIPGQDGIKWYDGDPTNDGYPVSTATGWVNFAPPLTATTVSINGTPPDKYYLVGALVIIPYKDRLLFFSPWIQASDQSSPIQLEDTVIWSWNGTPYYTVTSTGAASLVPTNQMASLKAYYVDQTGLGGWLSAGISQPIATVGNHEDALLVGFGGQGRKTRFTYTANDLQPFLFFNINSELPSNSTYSTVVLDGGTIDLGTYGICLTNQQSASRIDLDIPDLVFNIRNMNNGILRVNAVRDFTNEWIYFSYPTNSSLWDFPTQTFFFNYRDNTWAIFYENWTAHGYYRATTDYSWLTIPYESWEDWSEPWNAGSSAPYTPRIVAGNPQGYVLQIGEGTGEAPSGTIMALAAVSGITQITSTNHCVDEGDYLYIANCIGNTSLNGLVGRVTLIIDANNFLIDLPLGAGTYLGLGNYARLSQPLLQTKQFPLYWNEGRQVQLMVQKYLLDKTTASQATVNIYLSQDDSTAWNNPINAGEPTNALIYSQLLYTCPEGTNLGLTPANVNLQNPLPLSSAAAQIWHRYSTSLIGDTVQIGFTLNDAQMRNLVYATDEITLHGIQLTTQRGPHLA